MVFRRILGFFFGRREREKTEQERFRQESGRARRKDEFAGLLNEHYVPSHSHYVHLLEDVIYTAGATHLTELLAGVDKAIERNAQALAGEKTTQEERWRANVREKEYPQLKGELLEWKTRLEKELSEEQTTPERRTQINRILGKQ